MTKERKFRGKEFRDRVIQECFDGIPHREISTKHDVSLETVRTWAYNAGIRPGRRTILTEELKESLVSEFNAGTRIRDWCSENKISEDTARGYLTKLGVKMGRDRKTNQTWNILALHKKGNTVREISKELNIPAFSVTNALFNNGFGANKHKWERRMVLNHNYFQKIHSNKCAYFFGLLCADGCVQIPSKRIGISLKLEDGYLVEALKQELQSDAPVVRYTPNIKGSDGLRVQFYSDKMVSDLIRLGCVERKSLILKFPKIEEKYFWHFLRGYFDGNGSMSFSKRVNVNDAKRFSICASRNFNTGLQKILKNRFGINACLSLRKNDNTDLVVIRRLDIEKIRLLMYDNDEIYMKRKKERFFMDNYYEKNNLIAV